MNTIKANKLKTLIPALHTRLTAELATSTRVTQYPAIAPLADTLQSRFTALNPSDDEAILSIDLEEKQQIEEQLDTFFMRIVSAVYQLKVAAELPEWLTPRRKKTVDIYAEEFAGLHSLSPDVRSFIDTQQTLGVTCADAERLYTRWQTIYAAQQSKSEIMQKVSEIIDIKQAYLGLLRLLGVPTIDLQLLTAG